MTIHQSSIGNLQEWVQVEIDNAQRAIAAVEDRRRELMKRIEVAEQEGTHLDIGPIGEPYEVPLADLLRDELAELPDEIASMKFRIEYLNGYTEIEDGEFIVFSADMDAIRAHLASFPSTKHRLRYLYWLDREMPKSDLSRLPFWVDFYPLDAETLDEILKDKVALRKGLRRQIQTEIDYLGRLNALDPPESTDTIRRLKISGHLNQFAAIVAAMREAGILDTGASWAAIASHFSYTNKMNSLVSLEKDVLYSAVNDFSKGEHTIKGEQLMTFLQLIIRQAYQGDRDRLDTLNDLIQGLLKVLPRK